MFYLFYYTGLLIWSLFAVMIVMLVYQALLPTLLFRYLRIREHFDQRRKQELQQISDSAIPQDPYPIKPDYKLTNQAFEKERCN